ncbi:response regulator transcription factor [Microbacterium abyssi]|uniref:response regulator transcription factor n=1 Tax=Microbacterium abyssi TaxID=2782166 RepID=UPI00188889E8|nr:response regulator transcription factor [Microbacterium sp. A18JL241]
MANADVPSPVRVLVVDDEPLIRSGFRFVLAVDTAIEVIGEAADGAAAVDFVRAHRPDVVLMDVRMPGVGGPEATAAIVAQSEARVLAMTSIDAEDQLLRMLSAGASGYLLKDEPPARIADAVLRTAAGDTVVSGRSTAQLVRRAVEAEGGTGRRAAEKRVAVLTGRERDVAQGVARGETNQEIGSALHVSAGTVKTHLEQVFAKLGVRSRVQVGIILERAGLGPADL